MGRVYPLLVPEIEAMSACIKENLERFHPEGFFTCWNQIIFPAYSMLLGDLVYLSSSDLDPHPYLSLVPSLGNCYSTCQVLALTPGKQSWLLLWFNGNSK